MLNEGNYKGRSMQLKSRWNKIGTTVSQGLVNRRECRNKALVDPNDIFIF